MKLSLWTGIAYSNVELNPQRDTWGSLIWKLNNEELILTLPILSDKIQHLTEHNMIFMDIRLSLEHDMKGLNTVWGIQIKYISLQLENTSNYGV
jgi:hypothetical protein